MKYLPIICLLLLSFAPPTEAPKKTKWLEGEWKGMGFQPIDGQSWTVILTVNSKGEMSINYPSLKCSGVWKLGKTKKGYVSAVETILKGKDNCDNNVKVVVTKIDAEYISVAYFMPGIIDGVVASSVLRKSGVNRSPSKSSKTFKS